MLEIFSLQTLILCFFLKTIKRQYVVTYETAETQTPIPKPKTVTKRKLETPTEIQKQRTWNMKLKTQNQKTKILKPETQHHRASVYRHCPFTCVSLIPGPATRSTQKWNPNMRKLRYHLRWATKQKQKQKHRRGSKTVVKWMIWINFYTRLGVSPPPYSKLTDQCVVLQGAHLLCLYTPAMWLNRHRGVKPYPTEPIKKLGTQLFNPFNPFNPLPWSKRKCVCCQSPKTYPHLHPTL